MRPVSYTHLDVYKRQSDTEAYGGHLGKARELTKRAVDSAIRADKMCIRDTA